MKKFRSEHDLIFEVAPWEPIPGMLEFYQFRVGTCEGLWRATKDSYDILAVVNKQPGNGHFKDVLQWFEQSCQRDKRALKVLEIWNPGLKKHLIGNGFMDIGNNNVEKKFE